MSNLPLQSAVNHNDDNDEQTNSTSNKLSTLNSRITSPLIIKRQQNTETEIANNQAYDEIHDLQPKHSLSKRINNDNSYIKNPTRTYQSHQINSRELMQGNYYDQTRYDMSYGSSSNHQSESILININVEDYKKTFAQASASKNSNNKNRTGSPPFGDTSESIQKGIAESASVLLERNKKPDHHQHKSSMKTNVKSHEQTVINCFPNNNEQRSLSPSSSDCSTSDTSTSNKSQEDNTKTNIPYEKLLNDDDNDDEQVLEQTKKSLTESTMLLSKTHSQTYGTQTTTSVQYERSKYLPNNGYNSHGSSVTTKSSSDNSGSIRTNSGTDNDEESDEEHYNNSALSNNPHSMLSSRTKESSVKLGNKTNDIQYSYPNDQTYSQSRRINKTQTSNNDEPHLQVPRIKQLHTDHTKLDLNGNVNKLNLSTENNNVVTFPYKASQPSSNTQTNTLSSSHQNRNLLDRNDQQQNSSSLRNNTRVTTTRGAKKRKQSQQQEMIRTELIPGHRGDLDVDELVMFIDGDSSKQRQNSTPLRPTDTNKPRLSSKINALNDTNSNKTSSRKKSRKLSNNQQESMSSSATTTTSNNENTITHEQSSEINNLINEDNQTKTNHSSNNNENRTIHNNDESHITTIDVNPTKTINKESSQNTSIEQKPKITSSKLDDIDFYSVSSALTNTLNSEIINEPFVTVKNRRRLPRERRQDNNLSLRSTNIPPSLTSPKINDKKRIPPNTKNGFTRPVIRNNISTNKVTIPSIPKEQVNNQISVPPVRTMPPPSDEPSNSFVHSNIEQPTEKQQLSPRLSSHSSSSSLSSLLKRQVKYPPVVFVDKSADIELGDVSFGFEPDPTPPNESSEDQNNNNENKIQLTTEADVDTENLSASSSSIQPTQSNDTSNDSTTQKPNRKFQQRNNRSPQFYSGSDIRPHQQRNYPTQQMPHAPYIDPLLLFQYNQRLANYSQQLTYMNLLRTQYMPPQSQYVFLPTSYATAPTATTNDNESEDTTTQASTDQVQEPLLVYATPTGQFYYQQPVPKKSSGDSEQEPTSIPTVYTGTAPPIYPQPYFYPTPPQHMIPTHPAYFQPIPTSISSSLLIETTPEENTNDIDTDNYKDPTVVYPQKRQQSSADIMSNALQLVYSQQRRNAQTDRFNLDDLTAYLAMKWTDTVNHFEHGDNRILLVNEQN